jgi:hypothetical protein
LVNIRYEILSRYFNSKWFWGKNELVFDLKISKFNSELEAVEENGVSPDMDVWLALEGKGRPI